MGTISLIWTCDSCKTFVDCDGLLPSGEKMKAKVKFSNKEEVSFGHKYKGSEEPRRINLNDLLKRSKEEKAKMKKTNVLVFSAVLCSAALVVVIISFL